MEVSCYRILAPSRVQQSNFVLVSWLSRLKKCKNLVTVALYLERYTLRDKGLTTLGVLNTKRCSTSFIHSPDSLWGDSTWNHVRYHASHPTNSSSRTGVPAVHCEHARVKHKKILQILQDSQNLQYSLGNISFMLLQP